MYSYDLWFNSTLYVLLHTENQIEIIIILLNILKFKFYKDILKWTPIFDLDFRFSSLRFILRDHKQPGILENQNPGKYKM